MTLPPPGQPDEVPLPLRPVPLFLLAAVLLLAGSWFSPLDRNQEARVLETAREMHGQPLHDWLIPRCNGQVRLQKPPLCYWMAAGSYQIFGVSVFAGRLPFIACSLGLLLLTRRIANHLFDARVAAYAMAAMLATLHLQRYGKLAETDVPAAFFATLAIDAIFRAASSGRLGWHVLSGLGIGLSVLAKGPPALLPVIFLVAYVVYTRNWRLGANWLLVAAPVATLVALPWFLYIRYSPESVIVRQEIQALVAATRHPGRFHDIPGYVVRGALPWSGFLVLAIGACFNHLRTNRGLATVGLWWLSFLLPLLLLPQKQDHYAIPLLPASMMLVAWVLDRALEPEDEALRSVAMWFLVAVAVGMFAAVAIPLVSPLRAGRMPRTSDGVTAAVFVAGAAVIVWRHRRGGMTAAIVGMLAVAPVALATLVNYWSPSRTVTTFDDVSRRIEAAHDDGPYAFHPAENLRLVFHMQRVIPAARTEDQLRDMLAATPDLLVISEQDKGRPTTMPTTLRLVADHEMDDKHIRVYRRAE